MTSQMGGFFVVKGGEYYMPEIVIRRDNNPTQRELGLIQPETIGNTGGVIDQIDQLVIPTGVGDLIKMRALAVLGTQNNGSFSMKQALMRAGSAQWEEVNAAILHAVEHVLEDPDTKARRTDDPSRGHIAITRYGSKDRLRYVGVETAAAQLLYEIPPAGITPDGEIIQALQLSFRPIGLGVLETKQVAYTLVDRINPW